MFTLKIHEKNGEILIAACDKELIGKTLTDGSHKVDITKEFYGEASSLEEILGNLKNASMANFMGDNLITELVESNILEDDSVMDFCGIKHAQIFSV